MLRVLSNRRFRHLFFAQVVALVGTGLATVALALLAYDLAGDNAGRVMGMALAIKMIASVGVSPVASAFLSVLPRRRILVLLDLWRAAMVVFLPFVTEICQVYLLIFLLQSGSAAFTPAFQATIPDVPPDEEDYTNALSLSRLACDLESLVSPLIAALLLGLLASNALFGFTALGFLLSAALVISTDLSDRRRGERRSVYERTTSGIRIYLATPRLRGLLAVNMAVAAAAALAALALAISTISSYQMLLVIWLLCGLAYASALVPSGRWLRRSARAEDRPAVFAAQFALSHACWLVTYPLAGWLGSSAGLPQTAIALSAVAILAGIMAHLVWPRTESGDLEHSHDDLPPDHPHLREGHDRLGAAHSHDFVIDDLHLHWPGRQG